jgi:hypothetical protein
VFCSAGTITDGCHALPNTSRSPVRVSEPMLTCCEPRAASSDPEPSERVQGCAAPLGVAASAPGRLTRPLPTKFGLLVAIRVAVDVSAFFTMPGVQSGCALRRSATTPEVTAAACDVPLPRKNRLLKIAFGYFCARKQLGEASKLIT